MIAVLVHKGEDDNFKTITIDYPPQEFIVEDGRLWKYAGTQDGRAFYAQHDQ